PLCHHLFLFLAPSPPPTYTLSLHDALPIYRAYGGDLAGDSDDRHDHVLGDPRFGWDDPAFPGGGMDRQTSVAVERTSGREDAYIDRKSTRLNSSHVSISYAVFCLKKKKISK